MKNNDMLKMFEAWNSCPQDIHNKLMSKTYTNFTADDLNTKCLSRVLRHLKVCIIFLLLSEMLVCDLVNYRKSS